MYRYLDHNDFHLLLNKFNSLSLKVSEENLRKNLEKKMYYGRIEGENLICFLTIRNEKENLDITLFFSEYFQEEKLIEFFDSFEKKIYCYDLDETMKDTLIKKGCKLEEKLVKYKLNHFDMIKNKDVRVIKIEEPHLERVYEINKEAFSPLWAQEFEGIKRVFSLRDNTRKFIGIKNGDDIVAYLSYYLHESKGHIHRLAVAKAFEGQGYGGKLLDYALSHMNREEIVEVTLYTQVTNSRSRPLYENRGFKVVDERYVISYN